MHGLAVMEGLFQRVEHEARVRRVRDDPPADDAPCIGVDDESDVDEASPGGDIGEVGDPEHVWTWCPELTIDVILRARCGLVADRRADGLAADDAP